MGIDSCLCILDILNAFARSRFYGIGNALIEVIRLFTLSAISYR